MKIQILNNENEIAIGGYTPVFLKSGTFDYKAPENSITSILLIDVLEYIPHEKLNDFFVKIRQLLRLNGTITIRSIEPAHISREFINKNLTIDEYNSILFDNPKSGLYTSEHISKLLNKLNIQIQSIAIKGITYEIHGSRSN